MVVYLTSLEEIQNNIKGSKDWIKFGSKMGDPFLSLFNEDIKRTISQIEYEPGKDYKFTDDEFEYKIDVEQVGEHSKFTFFIKPKMIVSEYKKTVKNEKSDVNNNLLIGTIAFVLIEFLILVLCGVFQAIFR